MILKHRVTNRLFSITAGFILPFEKAKAKNVDGSYLVLTAQDTGEEVLYIWPYFADQEYTIEDLNVVDTPQLETSSDTENT